MDIDIHRIHSQPPLLVNELRHLQGEIEQQILPASSATDALVFSPMHPLARSLSLHGLDEKRAARFELELLRPSRVSLR